LWPVNDWALSKIPKLFAVNERVVLHLENSEVDLILVLVGAYNVGSISLVFNSFRSNLFSTNVGIDQLLNPALEIKRGERLATFHMGSSVAMFVFPKKNSQFNLHTKAGIQVKMGETLGDFI
jgi:phosphatidylserine decarboxylase